MSVLISNLNMIESIKLDIASAIEAKGVSMSGVSFPDYPSAIASISGGGSGYTEAEITERNFDIVNLNNSASYVGSNAFNGISTLVTVNLPNVTSIGGSAFYNCSNITDVSLSNCTQITGSHVFEGCEKLNNIHIPLCSIIGQYCFVNCKQLSSISLPLCENINNQAFRSCYALSQIDLPKCSLMGGIYTFANCSNLSVIMIGKDVSTVVSLDNTTAFQNTPIASGTGTIYVPASLVSDYQAAKNWSAFASQIVSIPE